jgi:hypothetical protein
VYQLQTAHIWNYGEIYFGDHQYTNRSSKNITITFSLTGVEGSFTDPKPFTLGEAPKTATYAGETLSFGDSVMTAQFVRFDVANNYGSTQHTGLGEVRFTAIPEPSSAFALLGGAAGLFARRRRRA